MRRIRMRGRTRLLTCLMNSSSTRSRPGTARPRPWLRRRGGSSARSLLAGVRYRRSATGFTSTSSTRSEEDTSELQSHWYISYAVFCLKKDEGGGGRVGWACAGGVVSVGGVARGG